MINGTGKRSKRSCQCPECRSLCQNEPGWFLPDEIEPASSFLGMTRQEFQSAYLTEHRIGFKAVLAPRYEVRLRRCVFFNGGQCKIHEVKPHECRKVYGCEARRRHKRVREMIAEQW